MVARSVIEHRLNTFLALPSLMREHALFQEKPWMGMMLVEDCPSLENLPDLWMVFKDVLKYIVNPRRKYAVRNMLHHLFMQALPCFHQNNKNFQLDEYTPVVLNLVMALVLGTYKFATRKPHFMLRVKFFRLLHKLIAGGETGRAEFMTKYPSIVTLACMEYIAQVTPMFWPAEYEFLVGANHMGFFFEKIPLLCDEFRVLEVSTTWDELEARANIMIHKCSRTRRLHRFDIVEGNRKRTPCDVNVFLECPVIPASMNGRESGVLENNIEFHLLSHAYQVPVDVLREGHSVLQVFQLPANVKKIQMQSLCDNISSVQLRYLNTRFFVCVSCAYAKNVLHSKFRLHIQYEKIVCSECMSPNVVSIDMIGRTLLFQNVTYVLCPVCCKVHSYQGDKYSWMTDCQVPVLCNESKGHHRHARKHIENADASEKTVKHETCIVCLDNSVQTNVFERVNLLTGELEKTAFCYKHQPSDYVLNLCVNVNQIRNLRIKRASWMPQLSKQILYDT